MTILNIKRIIIILTLYALIFACKEKLEDKNELKNDNLETSIKDDLSLKDTTTLIIPPKRKINLFSDLTRIGLKGNVRLVKYRYYDNFVNELGEINIDKGHIRNIDILSGLNPILENSVECNCDIYFDYDGFELKRVDYNSNEDIKSISLSFRDANGNLNGMTFIPEKELKIVNAFLGPYNLEGFRPSKKISTLDIGTEKHYFSYDQNKEIVLTWSVSRINNEPPKMITKYIYIYDERGNWVSRYVAVKQRDINNFQLIGAIEREISYFD
jgi:hypothetical protein